MNNSELSEAASSPAAYAEPQPYVSPSSWDTIPDDYLQSETLFRNGSVSDGMIGIECSGPVSTLGSRGMQPMERHQLEVDRLDLGLWLLSGAAIRHNQWERFGRIPKSTRETHDFIVNRSSSLVKRYCDIAGSLVLLVVFSPLFILVSILIKLESSGPVFFRHYRVGKDGKHFTLWKFRSMKMNVPQYEVSPQSIEDARLTRIGRLIRRMSIDEIPQLINVLRGEMSLVGPRPEMPFIVAQYHPTGCERLAARPGITGLWQISPARAFPIHENLQYDLHYIRNQNFFLDCAIILRTITAVIHGIGAV